MFDILPNGSHAIVALCLVAGMFVFFIRETYPNEVIALSGAVLMMVLGILPLPALLNVFSNPAPWTIAAMFVLSAALVRTGILNFLSGVMITYGKSYPRLILVALLAFTAIASAFMNNTPIVVLMIPIVIQMAHAFGWSASKLLIPLSYIAILGGMCTLIGTSTSLLVDGVAQEAGLAPFGLFEITPLAIILVGYGAVYLWLFGGWLLPSRNSMSDFLRDKTDMRYLTEVLIPEDSGLIGEIAIDVDSFKRDNGRVIDVVRGGESLRKNLRQVVLQIGDCVVLKSAVTELLGLKDSKDVRLVDRVSSREATIIEALVAPGCHLIGRTLGQAHLRRNFGVYPMALHRKNQNMQDQLDDIVIRIGDTLLLEGAPSDISRLSEELNMVDISKPVARPYRRGHAPIVVGVLGLIVSAALFGVAPIFALAALGVSVILLSRSIDAEEAFAAIDGRLLVLIFSMLGIGAGLQNSGAVVLIVKALLPVLQGASPFLLIWLIYMMTSVLTELVSNNAVAVVVTPVAIGLAETLGVDARPLVIAVMVSASASFATPIGYQTNTLVYSLGGYSFKDFLRIGVPLNISVGVLASFLIPMFWPL